MTVRNVVLISCCNECRCSAGTRSAARATASRMASQSTSAARTDSDTGIRWVTRCAPRSREYSPTPVTSAGRPVSSDCAHSATMFRAW
ncbi:hypothetical protein [Streptomyces katrae]|uniref:Uncharacterized protein n=1 Tax=Streptomyces katrae TaxID=68223 RepID=A0A0F4K1R3_9ACTN|nr:hypothetical protein [Streptomyces katrae]KJY39161.1 hypothetical protein VR44_02080 [Streptomyces katrae]